MNFSFLLRSFVLTGLLSASLSPLLGKSGDLDTTFGSGGTATTAIGVSAYGRSMVVQSDGKIVVAGGTFIGSYNDFALVRYNADGTLDSSFGTGGIVTTDFGGAAAATGVAIQSDGKIVAAGFAYSGSDDDFALARYNTDGSLDSSFGTGGTVTTGISFFLDDDASGVTLQSDGKIVVVGTSHNTGPNNNFSVARYNADGTLDGSFGTGGKLQTDFGGQDGAESVVVQSDGKIIAVGHFGTGTGAELALARYNTDGTLDNGFGSSGMVTTPANGPSNSAHSVVLQGDGKIIVAGSTNYGDSMLVRYKADGTLDGGFGSGGVVNLDFGGFGDQALSVTLQGDGKIVVSGASNDGFGTKSFGVLRCKGDGSLDNSFGTGGKVLTYLGANTYGNSVALQSDGRIVVAGESNSTFAVARYLAGITGPLDPPVDPPLYDTTGTVGGAAFLSFGAPAVDGGVVGGAAVVKANKKKQTIIYGDANGDVLAQTGGSDGSGATFTVLGDPIFAGDALAFAATAELTPVSVPALRRVGFGLDERTFAVKPGGKLGALYSQLNKAAGIHRLAGQADPAPGGGQFAKFGGFGLPRNRLGVLYSALLHRDGTVTPKNDFGIWRERSDGTGTDLMLRTGQRGFFRTRGGGSGRGLEKITFMPPVSNATDQRLSHAPDGGLGALADFDDGSNGVVRVAADGSVDVPLEQASPVPDEAGTADGNVQFVKFLPPATASGGRLALLAALQAAAKGQPAPPQAIFANVGGTMHRVLTRGDAVPGLNDTRWAQLGQPLLGEKGMIGLIAALTGKGAAGGKNKALVQIDNGNQTIVARLGDQVPDYGPGVVFRKFMSLVVTDSDPGRMVFTALVAGPGANGSNNVGLWSYSAAKGTKLVLRSGGSIKASGQDLTIRTFDALVAPKKSQGQGRSTDASGFVTAKAKLSDGRVGVLRIPLP